MLANRLSDATILATELYDVFHEVLTSNEEIGQAALADVIAVRERVRALCCFMLHQGTSHDVFILMHIYGWTTWIKLWSRWYPAKLFSCHDVLDVLSP